MKGRGGEVGTIETESVTGAAKQTFKAAMKGVGRRCQTSGTHGGRRGQCIHQSTQWKTREL